MSVHGFKSRRRSTAGRGASHKKAGAVGRSKPRSYAEACERRVSGAELKRNYDLSGGRHGGRDLYQVQVLSELPRQLTPGHEMADFIPGQPLSIRLPVGIDIDKGAEVILYPHIPVDSRNWHYCVAAGSHFIVLEAPPRGMDDVQDSRYEYYVNAASIAIYCDYAEA